LLAAAGCLAAITSIISLRNIPPTYQATATLIVGQTLNNPNPDSGEFYLGQQLASIYATLAMREPIRDAVKTALGLNALPDYAARAVPNNQLIEISVTDTSPERAQIVTNEIARQLILQSPSSSEQTEQARADFVAGQLDFLQGRIEEIQAQIADLQVQMSEMVSASDLADAQDTLDTLQTSLLTFQTNYASILSSSGSGAANILRVFESAQLPVNTTGPGRPIIIALAAILGVVLASGGAYLVEFFDNRLKTPEEISTALNLPIVGYIPASRPLNNFKVGSQRHELLRTISQESISFDLLATNLTFRFGETPPRSLLVTSLKPGSGKTTVASLLAMQFAMRGQKVTLVDADFRAPEIHNKFCLELHPGLGDALRDSIPFKNVVHSTSADGLQVITSGAVYEDHANFFKPEAVIRLLAQLEKGVDLIVIDSPPVITSETLLLASKLDAVLLIVRPGEIESHAARILLDQLLQSQGKILGVVVNKLPGYMVSSYGIISYMGHFREGKNPGEQNPRESSQNEEEAANHPASEMIEDVGG